MTHQSRSDGWAMVRLALLAGILGIACAHPPAPPLRSTHLLINRTDGHFRPYVRATIDGESFLLLVDTGALGSVLPQKFVRAHKLVETSGGYSVEVVDVHGQKQVMRTVKDVPIQFEGESSAGKMNFLSNPVGETRAGLLSPHDLVRPGFALTIDLDHEEIRYGPEEEALKKAPAGLARLAFDTCTEDSLFHKNHRVVVSTVNGVQARMMLDTGAERTVLERNNPALWSMMSVQGRVGMVHGVVSDGKNLVVSDVPVVFSKTTFPQTVQVSPASGTCEEGLLGADLLRHCTLIWGWDSLWAACHAPAEGE